MDFLRSLSFRHFSRLLPSRFGREVRRREEYNSIYFQILFNHLALPRMFAVRRVNWGEFVTRGDGMP